MYKKVSKDIKGMYRQEAERRRRGELGDRNRKERKGNKCHDR